MNQYFVAVVGLLSWGFLNHYEPTQVRSDVYEVDIGILNKWIPIEEYKPMITVAYAQNNWPSCYKPIGSLYCHYPPEFWELWDLGKCSDDGNFLYKRKIYTNFSTLPTISEKEWGNNTAHHGQRVHIMERGDNPDKQCIEPYYPDRIDPAFVVCVLPDFYKLSMDGRYFKFGMKIQEFC